MNALTVCLAVAAGVLFAPPPPLSIPPVPVVTPAGGEQQYAVNTWYSFEEHPCSDGDVSQSAWIMVTGPVGIPEAGSVKICVVSDSSRVVEAGDESVGWREAQIDATNRTFRYAIAMEEVSANGPWVIVFEDGVEKTRLRASP